MSSSLLADWRDRPTHRRVWALAAPMILSNISVPLVALVDSTVIGHLPHAHQLGAVAVGASLATLTLHAMGARLINVRRFSGRMSGPDDEAPLAEGDTLVLSGHPTALSLAEEKLLRG